MEGGQRGARLVEQTVLYSNRMRGTRTQRARPENIRMRLTYERQIVMGVYTTTMGHRQKDSVKFRIRSEHWDAVICEGAIQHARDSIAERLQPGHRRGIKTFAIVAVAEALHQNRAPVNHHTVSALLDVFGLECSRVWLNKTLRAAGWVPIQAWEMPDDAPGFKLTNWQPDGHQDRNFKL